MKRAGCLLMCMMLITACTAPRDRSATINNAPGNAPLEKVAEFDDRLVTGVTVTETGRIFVNFPLWYPQWYQGAVAELVDGRLVAYPDARWNSWRLDDRADPAGRFVCVQSVYADQRGSLWVLDPGAPWPTGLVADAPKLVRIDLASDRVARVYGLGPAVAPEGSYLNDVRIDHAHDHAYITDSGRGALVVVDLETGAAWRVLSGHPAAQAEDVTPMIGGRALTGPEGNVPKIHADGIAFDPARSQLYIHALTGYHTWQLPTLGLRYPGTKWPLLDLGSDAITDGMHLDRAGNLYFTALEYDGILKRDVKGNLTPVVIDPRLRWPDTLAIGPDGYLYITTSQIHLTPRFTGDNAKPDQPWALWRIKLDIEHPVQPE